MLKEPSSVEKTLAVFISVLIFVSSCAAVIILLCFKWHAFRSFETGIISCLGAGLYFWVLLGFFGFGSKGSTIPGWLHNLVPAPLSEVLSSLKSRVRKRFLHEILKRMHPEGFGQSHAQQGLPPSLIFPPQIPDMDVLLQQRATLPNPELSAWKIEDSWNQLIRRLRRLLCFLDLVAVFLLGYFLNPEFSVEKFYILSRLGFLVGVDSDIPQWQESLSVLFMTGSMIITILFVIHIFKSFDTKHSYPRENQYAHMSVFSHPVQSSSDGIVIAFLGFMLVVAGFLLLFFDSIVTLIVSVASVFFSG